MRKIFLVFFCIVMLTGSAYAQEILYVDLENSVVRLDGGQDTRLDDFLKSNQQILEGQKLEARFHIKKNPDAKPPSSYVLEMRTDLKGVEWQYLIFDEKPRWIGDVNKVTVWNDSRDHSAYSFDIEVKGTVTKPTVPMEEPHFKEYDEKTGEGPGVRIRKLVVFTIYDGDKKVTEVGEYTFLSSNSEINTYLNEINKNLDTSTVPKEYTSVIEQQKKDISDLSKAGHVGWALDMSRSFSKVVEKLKVPSTPYMLIGVVAVVIIAILTGLIGYKMGQTQTQTSPEFLKQIEDSWNILKQNSDKLKRIDISNISGAKEQAAELMAAKTGIEKSTADLKDKINQMQR